MKKVNVQVYEGDPSGLSTKDNNNWFITSAEYNDDGKITSINSMVDSEGGSMVPEKYSTFPEVVRKEGTVSEPEVTDAQFNEYFSAIWRVDIPTKCFPCVIDLEDNLEVVIPKGLQMDVIDSYEDKEFKLTFIKDYILQFSLNDLTDLTVGSIDSHITSEYFTSEWVE